MLNVIDKVCMINFANPCQTLTAMSKQSEDIFRGYYSIPEQSVIENMSDIELTALQGQYSPEDPGSIVVKNEWERRRAITTGSSTIKAAKIAGWFAIGAALIGVIGAIILALLVKR